jgi:membrane protein CcdC involved in cytochrome C biogenesis
MWVMPLLILLGIGAGLYFTPHEPFGPAAWAAFVAALAIGALAGWWRGKTITIQKVADGTLMAQASPFGLILIVGLLLGRTAIRSVMESQAAYWHVDAAVITDAFMLFAVGLVVAQRLEVFIRARAILAGGVRAQVSPSHGTVHRRRSALT